MATIVSAQRIEGADRLLLLKVDLGEKTERQVVAGLARYYRPEELVGAQVLFVANLKPVKLRGHLSQGMLLAAIDEDGTPVLTTVGRAVRAGSRVS